MAEIETEILRSENASDFSHSLDPHQTSVELPALSLDAKPRKVTDISKYYFFFREGATV
jgi:hypothetical protein